MFRPWLSKYQNCSTNEDPFLNSENEMYENSLDDFTLYLSDVSSHPINPIQMISLATIYGGFK